MEAGTEERAKPRPGTVGVNEVRMHSSTIRDEVKLAYLVRARTVNSEVVGSILAKTRKPENPDLHGFELHRP